MRSKEVDEAIHRLYNAQNNVWEATLYSKEQQEKDIFTTINYISKLEQLPNKIRDKIKDIEMQIKGEKSNRYTIPECFLILKTLKSIIGE